VPASCKQCSCVHIVSTDSGRQLHKPPRPSGPSLNQFMGCSASLPADSGGVTPEHVAKLTPVERERRCREIRNEVSAWIIAGIGLITLITAIAIHVHVVKQLPSKPATVTSRQATTLTDIAL